MLILQEEHQLDPLPRLPSSSKSLNALHKRRLQRPGWESQKGSTDQRGWESQASFRTDSTVGGSLDLLEERDKG